MVVETLGRLGGLHSGHHGARILILVVLLVIVAVVVVTVVRRKRESDVHHEDVAPKATVPSESVASSRALNATSPARVHRGGGRIVANGLTKHYGTKIAVNDLSFSVEPGHVTGFLGPNGAGKSTTMRMIMGLDAPDRGTVTLGGRKFHDLAWPLREVGALLEAKAIHPGRSAYAHLWMLARSNHIARQRVDEVLELVGLTSVGQQRAGGFSLGMGQRLGIAGALLGDPGILLFDEPVNGLDTDGIRWVRQLLSGLAAEGRTVFVSSHLMSEMAMTADRVVVIGQGHLIAETSVAEFTAKSAHGFVRVRSPQLDTLRAALEEAGAKITNDGDAIAVRELNEEKIGEIAWRQSIQLYELAPQAASLEDAFIESTEGELEFHVDHRPPAIERTS